MGVCESKLTASYAKIEGNLIDTDITTIPDCLSRYATTKPNSEAIIFASTDGSREAVTWKELYVKSEQVAKGLIKLGVKQQEFVVNNLRNCSDWLFLTFGSMMAGARPISIAFTYKDGRDVVAMMEKLGTCSLAVIDPGIDGDKWNIFNSLIDEYDSNGNVKSSKMPYLRNLLCHKQPEDTDKVKTIDELISDAPQDIQLPLLDADDTAALFQTSGSTGVPKVACHTHKSIMAATGLYLKDAYTAEDIVYNDRPFTWMGGFPVGLLIGQTRVTLSGNCPQPKEFVRFMIDVIRRERCTAAVMLPHFLHEMLSLKDELKYDWPLKSILTGGQPINKGLAECLGTLCKIFICLYGATEFLIPFANVVTKPEDFIEYACGTQFQNLELKIVNDTGEIVPVNTRGEIYLRAGCLFSEYFNDPIKTKAVKSEDGWYRTDDLGRITEDGVFFAEGRKSNMILSGGLTVAPEILETLLKTYPNVVNVVIVPIPDKVLYQTLCACVVVKPGSGVTEETIRSYCKEMHTDNCQQFTVLPKYFMFLEKFPELSTGKTSRVELLQMAEKKFLSD